WEKEMFDRELKVAEEERRRAELAEDIRHNKRQERLQSDGISSAARTAREGRQAEMLRQGFVPDAQAPGGFRDAPELAAKLRGPESPADEKAALELEQARRGDVIVDSQGNVLGRPRAQSEEA